MLYRKLGKTGCKVSILSFGCMRLPIKNGIGKDADRFDPTKAIDEEKATELIHYAMDRGAAISTLLIPIMAEKVSPCWEKQFGAIGRRS